MRFLSFMLVVAFVGKMPGVLYAHGAGIAIGVALLLLFLLSYAQYRGWRKVISLLTPLRRRVRRWLTDRRLVRLAAKPVTRLKLALTGSGKREKAVSLAPSSTFRRYAAIALPPLSPVGNGMVVSAALSESFGLHRHRSAVVGAASNVTPVFVTFVLLNLMSPAQLVGTGLITAAIYFAGRKLRAIRVSVPSASLSMSGMPRPSNYYSVARSD